MSIYPKQPNIGMVLWATVSTIIYQHDLYGQLSDGIIEEDDEEFANLEKDEIDAKKRE